MLVICIRFLADVPVSIKNKIAISKCLCQFCVVSEGALVYISGIITLNFFELAAPLTQKSLLFSTGITTAIPLSAFLGASLQWRSACTQWSTLAVNASTSPHQHLQKQAEASSLLRDKTFPLYQALLFSSEVHKAFPILLGTFNTHQVIDICESLRITQSSGNKNPFCTHLQTAVSTLQTRLPWL